MQRFATFPTPAVGDNSTNAASTAFVFAAKSGVVTIATTGGTITLSAAQYGSAGLLITGTLAANAVIVVPNTGNWIVANRCTGAFTLTVKTAAGTGVPCTAGFTADLIADGTNVVIAGNDFAALNVAGTGSTDMAGAWSTTTSPVTAITGSFASANCAIRYKKFGRTVFVNAIVNIISVGTASGYTAITLPFASFGKAIMPGRDEVSSNSLIGSVQAGSAMLAIQGYTGGNSPISNNTVFTMQGTYETAS